MSLHERYRSRVTIDNDGPKHGRDMEAVQAWHNLRDMADRVDVHVSSSGKGLHFVAWFEADLSFAEKVQIRREHGDDPRRVDMDCKRWLAGMQTDVLFGQKDGGQQVKERRFRDVYDALDFIKEQRRDDGRRMKRFVEHGHKVAPDYPPRMAFE